MKRKRLLLLICLATSGLLSSVVFADDKPIVPDEFLSEPVFNEIELGIGGVNHISDDAYRFGRYNGMQTEGAFMVGNIDVEQFSDDGSFWNIHGTNLGLESRYLRMETGMQGRYKFFLEYDEIPNYKDNTVETPFRGVESDNLTLPAGFDITTNINTYLQDFELSTKRERIGAGASFIPKQHWQFDIDFSHETKEGIDATGAAIANGASGGGGPGTGGGVVGKTFLSLVPEPIDYQTNIVNASLSYADDNAQLKLAYHMSLFDNGYDSLQWDNPDPAGTVAAGNISLAPDNEFHQLSLTGAYTLPYRSHLTGHFSLGRMTQNQEYEPYTISPLTTPDLPRNSLDGEVWLVAAKLKLISRPINKLRLNAELSYNERDNQTPIESYTFVVMDSFGGGTVQNRPASYQNNRIKLDARYRFNAITSLSGGFKYEDIDRTYINSERENTEENTFFAKWKIKPHTTVDVALYAETSSRDGSEYNVLVNEDPAMRKYHVADRDRTKVGTKIDFMATDKLFLSARADYNKDEYNNSPVGLTEATQPSYTVDFSYQPRINISTYGYYTYETINSIQSSVDTSPVTTTAGWEAEFDDLFDTVGVGAEITDLGRWNIGMDLVHSESRGESEVRDLGNLGTEDQYPDNKTEMSRVKLWTSYDYNKQLTYKLDFMFEEYSEENWLKGFEPYDGAAVDNSLLLGNEILDYHAYAIAVSAIYKY
jgi:MtrB/PioB family decaheme-associated outer membrane protein